MGKGGRIQVLSMKTVDRGKVIRFWRAVMGCFSSKKLMMAFVQYHPIGGLAI